MELTNEWAARARRDAGDACGVQGGKYIRCDDNGFALEIVDEAGAPAGRFTTANSDGGCDGPAPADPDVYVLADGSGVTHSGAHHGRIRWTLCWIAPPAGTGPLTAYVSAVDGNGGDGTPDNPNDMTGDDVFTGAVPMLERGGDLPDPTFGGCSAGGASTGAGALAVLALLVIGVRRRRGAVAALALALALALGALRRAGVRPWQREKLAKRTLASISCLPAPPLSVRSGGGGPCSAK